jgi:hypothetical protein
MSLTLPYKALEWNFKTNQIVADSEGNQYEIVDAENNQVTLELLPKDERVKVEFIAGRLDKKWQPSI